MRVTPFAITLLAVALGGALPAATAQAQMRTFVSGVGDDRNACTRTAPCKTFTGALGQTQAGGEINCLDSGDFGAVTINKAITIDCDAVTAGITGTGSGITVQAGSSDVVIVRGLDILGFVLAPFGVDFKTGLALHVEHCRIRGFQGGIAFEPQGAATLVVQDSTFSENGAGVDITPATGGSVVAALDHVRITRSAGAGVRVEGGGPSTVSIADSTIRYNAGNGVLAQSGPFNVAVHIDRTVLASNTSSGVQSNQTGGGLAAVTLRGSTLTNNANGNVNSVGGGTLITFGDNDLVGLNGTGFTGPLPLQ